MKIKEYYDILGEKYNKKLKIFKKGIFRIMIDEEAFFMSKYFNMKITKLDKESIKIGFPDGSKSKWLNILEQKGLSYILIEKISGEFLVNYTSENGNYYNSIFSIDLEDYLFTKQRILSLKTLEIEDKNEKNFLLKAKLEDIYIIYLERLMKLPKKERYYFRDKVERLFMDLFEDIYKYMYNLANRNELIELIFSKSIILREYFRFFYKIGVIKNDNVFIDLGDRWIEVLKICKGIKNKN